MPTTSGDHGRLEWMRTLALRYRHIKEIYEAFNGDAAHLLGDTKAEVWTRVCGEVDRLTRGWCNHLRHILEVISARPSYRNVLISSSPLPLTFTRLLLHGLGRVFAADNVYAANKIGKETCFERISARFGRKAVCIVIGSTAEQRNLALQLNWPYWDISLETDLVALAHALELGFL
ncbi:unnamed protein product [Schistocephalus solidus]|uniref:Eyes absent homolog n=1 Tax=Schistocephalus solidus TaxID=70667 RepID=A0A183T432_SCHSO|nr:unnamed protein product [Schistocephalus solidus]